MSTPTSAQPTPAQPNKLYAGHRMVLSICFILFACELGFCLVRLPWMGNWDTSYVPMHVKGLADLWMSHYFRGALSGLGLLNLYVAAAELKRLLKGRRRRPIAGRPGSNQ